MYSASSDFTVFDNRGCCCCLHIQVYAEDPGDTDQSSVQGYVPLYHGVPLGKDTVVSSGL